MKNIRIVLFATLIFLLAFAPAYAANDIKVTIDGNEISFETAPELKGKTVMVPMKEFFEAMGASVDWYEEDRKVVAYKDNTHLRLQIGNKIAYRNGHEFTLDQAPYISDGHTLVPLQIIAETFSMKPSWNSETSILALTSSQDDAGIKFFTDSIYKTKPINELGITISIPYHWENLDGPFQYGYQDDFESYSVTLMSQPIDKNITLEKLVEENRALLLDTYDENITFTGEDEINIDNILKGRKLYITTTLSGQKQKQVLYILKQGNKAYYMTCHYGNEVPEEDIIVVFDNIISTFRIRNLSIDSEEEHYMEFPEFYETGVQLNSEYYSNMVVEKSEIPFSGTLKDQHGLEAFNVKVTSDKDSLDFTIPIAGNAFDGTIYTPFGLGKHNIFITGVLKDDVVQEDDTDTAPDTTEEKTSESSTDQTPNKTASTSTSTTQTSGTNTKSDTASSKETTSTEPKANTATQPKPEKKDPADDVITSPKTKDSQAAGSGSDVETIPLMQFSVVNIDSRAMRYRIPTNIINSSDVQINSTSMLITYQSSGEYTKARALYNWMLNNITIADDDIHRSNIQVFDEATGSPEQINQLYVAYLRAIDIPSRVRKGTIGSKSYYWSELYLNGSWIVSDIIEGILVKDDEATDQTQGSLFNINFTVFKDKFDYTQIMPY